jgi:imidazoleglycerol-phosphate dehydratase
MLTALSTYAGWGLELSCQGDSQVDLHHSLEDCGLVLGSCLSAALGDFSGHRRFGQALVPMDEALAEAALDAGNRPYLYFEAAWPQVISNSFDFSLVEEFFRALCQKAGWTLHLTGRRGRNSHHLSEALFKACGLAARTALAPRADGTQGPFSTKGLL